MSDPMDTVRDGDPLFAAAAEYGRTHLGWTDDEEPVTDPVDVLLERAENAMSPELGLLYAQMATARAIQAQTEQARIGNLLALGQFRVGITDLSHFRHLVMEAVTEWEVQPTAEIRKGLGLS